jgi:hypothetical protein
MSNKFLTYFRYAGTLVLLSTLAACGGSGYSDTAYVAPPATPPAVMLTVKTATLSPTQEVAEVSSLATGTGTLSMNPSIGGITGSITTVGMTATAAHIHAGVAGTNGAIIVELARDAAVADKWNVPPNTVLSPAQQTIFNNGGLYFNAHSASFPTGEIRGQIGREVALARLSGVQEVAQNTSAAFGLGTISIDPVTKLADVSLIFSGITPVAAHIHTGAVGVNGPITFELGTPTAAGFSVSAIQFSDAQLAAFRAKGQYFNMHSVAFPSGEIRGQIGYQVRIASMNGAQENPPVFTASTGVGYVAYDPDTKKVFAQLTTVGYTPSAGHIHRGATGVNGPIIVEFEKTAANAQSFATANLATITDADALLLLNKGLYLNAHSPGFPTGETRGQLLGNR